MYEGGKENTPDFAHFAETLASHTEILDFPRSRFRVFEARGLVEERQRVIGQVGVLRPAGVSQCEQMRRQPFFVHQEREARKGVKHSLQKCQQRLDPRLSATKGNKPAYNREGLMGQGIEVENSKQQYLNGKIFHWIEFVEKVVQ